jgi:hypothetical protein
LNNKSHNKDTIYVCDECNEEFVTEYIYNRHLKSHPQLFYCEKCNEEFVSDYVYKRHLKSHQSFYCEKCNVSLSYKSSYKIHLKSRTHNKDMIKYECKECNKEFFSEYYYQKHLDSNVHKIFKCEKCEMTFKLKSTYRGHLNSQRHLLTKEEYKIYQQQLGYNANFNGDSNEAFIVDIINSLNFSDVVYVGNTGNKFDVFIKYKDESFYRGVQIKTLIHYAGKISDRYIINSGQSISGYYDDTLIVAVTNDKSKFALLFYGEKTKKNTSVPISHLYNVEEFKKQFIIMCKKSTIVENFDDHLHKHERQEADSMNRFKIKCDELGITFERNITNRNEIDAIVNGYKVQFKSSLNIKGNRCEFSISRFIGQKHIPYSDEDEIDIFVFEIVSNPNIFYIVPKKLLIETKFLSTKFTKGRLSIGIPLPNHSEYRWLLQCIDKFNIFKGEDINLYFNTLHKQCDINGLSCTFNSRHKVETINNLSVRSYIVNGVQGGIYMYLLRIKKNKILCNIDIEDGFKFLIFEIGKDDPDVFYIIPIEILIKKGYIKTNDQDGNYSIKIHHNIDKKHWTQIYKNRFDLLE